MAKEEPEGQLIYKDAIGHSIGNGDQIEIHPEATLLLGDKPEVRGSSGTVLEIGTKGKIKIQFPGFTWWVFCSDIVVISDYESMKSIWKGMFHVKDTVYLKEDIKPRYGSAGVKGGTKGTIKKIDDDIIIVDFPTNNAWRGSPMDLVTEEAFKVRKIRLERGEYMKFTDKQKSKAIAQLTKNMKDANAAFKAANPTYSDLALDTDDIRLIAATTAPFINSSNEPKSDADREKMEAAIQKIRMDFIMASRPTATLDLLTVKTEKNIGEDDKFKLTPYLAAKKYRRDGTVWKKGYQSPFQSDPILNEFIDVDGGTFAILRSSGLLQLMTDAEIEELAAKTILTLDLYFQLFM